MIAQHEIGNYTLGRKVDLMFGGGRCFFTPSTTPKSCRKDPLDLLDWAQKNGWHVGTTKDSFDSLTDSSR
jgi:alkaline phosphatase